MSIYVQKSKRGLLECGVIPPPFLLSNEIISKVNLLRRPNMCYSKMASEMKESTVIVVQNAWSSNSHCEFIRPDVSFHIENTRSRIGPRAPRSFRVLLVVVRAPLTPETQVHHPAAPTALQLHADLPLAPHLHAEALRANREARVPWSTAAARGPARLVDDGRAVRDVLIQRDDFAIAAPCARPDEHLNGATTPACRDRARFLAILAGEEKREAPVVMVKSFDGYGAVPH